MILDVKVTDDMIMAGQQKVCSRCPVALALRTVIGSPVMVYICGGPHFLLIINTNKRYLLPEFVSNWIRCYDYCGAGSPFSFKLVIDG